MEGTTEGMGWQMEEATKGLGWHVEATEGLARQVEETIEGMGWQMDEAAEGLAWQVEDVKPRKNPNPMRKGKTIILVKIQNFSRSQMTK